MKRSSLLIAIWCCLASCGHAQNTAPESDAARQHTRLVKTQGSDKYANIHAIINDAKGNLWIATTGEGIYRYDGKYFTQFTTKEGLNSNTVYALAADKAGNVWIGTDNGLCRYDGKAISREPIITDRNPYLAGSITGNSVPGKKNEVWCILQDKTGLLWLGTREGLYCYDGKNFSRFLDRPGLVNKDSLQLTMVNCLLEDSSGTIWIGSGMPPGMEGLCRFDGKSITRFKPGGDGWIRYLAEDHAGNIWIGGRTKGIWRYDGKTYTRFTTGPEFGLATLVDHSGNVWFSASEENDGYSAKGGLWRYNGAEILKLSDKGPGNYAVWSMAQDSAGNIWLGTRNNELYRYDGHTFTKYSE
jgi:ligand-binding sensor domain-containing protein